MLPQGAWGMSDAPSYGHPDGGFPGPASEWLGCDAVRLGRVRVLKGHTGDGPNFPDVLTH